MAIHPNQVAAINAIFTPKPEEVARAHEIVQAFADNPDAGVLAIRGHMVDRAHVKGAERILARAKAAEYFDVAGAYSAALSFSLAIASSGVGRSMEKMVSGRDDARSPCSPGAQWGAWRRCRRCRP